MFLTWRYIYKCNLKVKNNNNKRRYQMEIRLWIVQIKNMNKKIHMELFKVTLQSAGKYKNGH